MMGKSSFRLWPHGRSFAGRLTQSVVLTMLLIMMAITCPLDGIIKPEVAMENSNEADTEGVPVSAR